MVRRRGGPHRDAPVRGARADPARAELARASDRHRRRPGGERGSVPAHERRAVLRGSFCAHFVQPVRSGRGHRGTRVPVFEHGTLSRAHGSVVVPLHQYRDPRVQSASPDVPLRWRAHPAIGAVGARRVPAFDGNRGQCGAVRRDGPCGDRARRAADGACGDRDLRRVGVLGGAQEAAGRCRSRDGSGGGGRGGGRPWGFVRPESRRPHEARQQRAAEAEQADVDQILAKISESGLDSLSKRERKLLDRVSKKNRDG